MSLTYVGENWIKDVVCGAAVVIFLHNFLLVKLMKDCLAGPLQSVDHFNLLVMVVENNDTTATGFLNCPNPMNMDDTWSNCMLFGSGVDKAEC